MAQQAAKRREGRFAAFKFDTRRAFIYNIFHQKAKEETS